MVILDLNNFPEDTSCCDLARWLIAEKGHYPTELIQFMRGDMKVFKKNFNLDWWSKRAVQESTKGEKMRHVAYRGKLKQFHPPKGFLKNGK